MMIRSSCRCLLALALFASYCTLSQAQAVTVPSTSVSVAEDAGSVTITLTIAPIPVGIWGASRMTADGTATAGDDYTALTSTTVSDSGVATIDITIDILDDNNFDPAETFELRLTGISGPTPDITVTITIVDDERIPVNLTQIADVSVRESVGNFTFMISRDGLMNAPHEINITLDTMDGTAMDGQDYNGVSNMMVNLAENQGATMAYVYIIDDEVSEDPETFCVTIHGPQITENITFYVTIIDNDTPDNFHCRRGVSQPCLNMGMCNSGDGTCNCTADFQGENCGIETANITTGCGCVNGTCVNDGCICDGGSAGALCDQKAYSHQCVTEANGFSVCITPFSVDTFNGVIYVLGHYDEAECTLTRAPNPSDPDDDLVDWCEGYAAVIGFNSTCGELGPNEVGGVTSFKLELMVQYSSFTFRNTDELVTFTCGYNNGSLTAYAGVHPVDNTGTNVQRDTSSLLPVSLTMTDVLGFILPSPLDIGFIAMFCISVAEVNAFNSVSINTIFGNNTRSGTDYRELTLYNFGCVPSNASGIITSGPTWSNGQQTQCFNIEVFIFAHDINLASPSLGIVIEFEVHANESAFTAHTCSSRRKRQASSVEGDKMGMVIYLINPDASKSDAITDINKTCSCSSWLVPALIGLGVVAITMAIVIIALTIAVLRQYREKKLP